MKNNKSDLIITIVGLGFVGLPLAEAFSQYFRVIGYDNNGKLTEKLNFKFKGNQNVVITDKPEQIRQADYIIIAVPTPVTKSKEPDLSYIVSASKTVRNNMKAGCTVILESTVYPGVTEEIVKTILEESGLKCEKDFYLAYCPERINPGDTSHMVGKVVKVVSGTNGNTTEAVAQLYNTICPSIFKASSIRTAEAAKVIENIQRDLNIALMNELSLIFERIGLNSKDVSEAAATKWNFHKYSPGLVGGHCIPVDPYYLVHVAEVLGYHPQIILAGRNINDYMPKHVAHKTIKALNSAGKRIKNSHVLIMGLTYKENVSDTRETPIISLIEELHDYDVRITGFDPLLDDVEKEFGIKAITQVDQAKKVDCIILAVAHKDFKKFTLDNLRAIMNNKPILFDVRGTINRTEAESKGFTYLTL